MNCVFYTQKQGSMVTVDDLVSQLDELVEKESSKPWLFGHSWGGVLAIEYAKKFQDKLAGVSLLGTGLSTDQWFRFKSDLEAKGLQDASPEETFLTINELSVGKKFLEEIWEGFSDDTFESISDAYLENFNLLKDLPNLEIPLLSFYGENDLRFSPEVARSFCDYNSAIIGKELPDSGHFPFLSENNRNEMISMICKHTA